MVRISLNLARLTWSAPERMVTCFSRAVVPQHANEKPRVNTRDLEPNSYLQIMTCLRKPVKAKASCFRGMQLLFFFTVSRHHLCLVNDTALLLRTARAHRVLRAQPNTRQPKVSRQSAADSNYGLVQRYRSPAPSKGARAVQAQAQEIGSVAEQLLHGRQVPGMLQYHNSVQPQPDRGHLHQLQHHPVHTNWRKGSSYRGMQLQKEGGLD